MDQQLDIVVGPDLAWRWKDEDHLKRSVELGWITPDEASGVWREGERVISLIEARAPPFDNSWTHWRPDPAWAIPQLDKNWNAIPPA